MSMQILAGQLLLGLINGAFYALLSLGLALIFGLLNIGNFTHGAFYMLGAFCTWWLLNTLGIGYWAALAIAPIMVGVFGILIEKTLLQRIYRLPHVYGLLLTFGMTLVLEGAFRQIYGTSGLSYPIPGALKGGLNLGFMFLPWYRLWVIGASLTLCLLLWYMIERTMLGAYLRAATENPNLTRALGIAVPRLITLTFGLGVGLAGLAGVMAAPIFQVNPLMGSNLVIIGFAVVVIGGLGSILGAIVAGFGIGVIEGFTKVFYPEGATTIIFVIMAVVLIVRPAGLFGRVGSGPVIESAPSVAGEPRTGGRADRTILLVLLALAIAAPFVVYPAFLMKALCLAIFASAFNLLIGYVGLLSFGHAAFFGAGAYITAIAAKVWGVPTEVALLCGTVAASCLGLLFGWIAIRRQGVYFAMVTLALSQVVYFYALQTPFAHGEDGIQDVPRGRLLGFIDLNDQINLYYLVLVVFVFSFVMIRRIIQSPFGRVLKAIRENEPRAISLGYDTDRFKLIAFVLSCGLAGLAGGTKSLIFQVAAPPDVHWQVSGAVVLMTLMGGLGTVLGPAVGALILTSMDYYLAGSGSWVLIIEGVAFIVFVLVFRRGVVGEAMALAQRLQAKGMGRSLGAFGGATDHAKAKLPPVRPA
jgi:branched-chain amino acid transport system permease protein